MTISVVIMIIIGLILIFASFFLSEKLTKKEDNFNIDLLTVDDNYEFSEREIRIIKRKIEDVIAKQAKDILYETNESLSNMANEKTIALGDYAVAVCEEIEKNHKEVMFLYSMLDDKQKEIMSTVKMVDEAKQQINDALSHTDRHNATAAELLKETAKKQSALDQLTALSRMKKDIEQDGDGEKNRSAGGASDKEEQEEKAKEAVVSVEMHQKAAESVDAVYPEQRKAVVTQAEEEDKEMEDIFAQIDQTEIDFDEVLEEFEENENSNDIILQMYRSGSSIIEIAKQLGLGVGEVKLVIDLYQGE